MRIQTGRWLLVATSGPNRGRATLIRMMNRKAFLPVNVIMVGLALWAGPVIAQGTSRISVDPRPVAVIGAVDGPGELLFQSLTEAIILPTGELLVADQATGELRVFTLSGEFVRSFGGQGAGPAEFRHIRGLIVHRDTIIVHDPLLGKQAYFNLRGELIGTESVGQFGTTLIGIDTDGRRWWSWLTALVPGPARDLTADSIAIGVNNPPGDRIDVVAGTIGTWRHNRSPYPFSPVTRPVLYRDSLLVADVVTGQVSVLDHRGRPGRVIDVQLERVAASSAWRILEQQVAEREGLRGRRISDLPRIDQLPRMAAMLVDAKDRIWIKEYDPLEDAHWLGGWAGGEGGKWHVLDARGRKIAMVALPPRFVPLHIGSDVVLGRLRDEWDVQYLAIYRIREQPGRFSTLNRLLRTQPHASR